jgi:hypothetical protein
MQDELSRELTHRLQQLLQAASTDSSAVTGAAAKSQSPRNHAALLLAAANFEQLIDAIQSTLQNVQEVPVEMPDLPGAEFN